MPSAKIVSTARLRPGKCVLSGETQGPLIDTATDIPRYGRVYISLKWLDGLIREAGYIHKDEAFAMASRNEELETELPRLQEVEQDFDNLLEMISSYLPQPEPEVIEREVKVPRAPTDEEIEEWIREQGGNHEAVKKAKTPEKGSTEEWFRIYGNPRKPKPQSETVQKEEKPQEEEIKPDEGPDKIVELYDQQVDLDKVLAENISTISQFLQDKPEYFLDAIVRREWHLAEQLGRKIRKGVLEPIGYWDDGPLYPDDTPDTNPEDEETIELGEDE